MEKAKAVQVAEYKYVYETAGSAPTSLYGF